MNQILKALTGRFCHFPEGRIAEAAAAIPVHLQSQDISPVTVVFRSLHQFFQGVLADFHTDIVGQVTGVVVKTPHSGVQQIERRADRQGPAAPGHHTFAHGDDHHQACQHHNTDGHSHHLPYEKIHTAGPLRQEGLQRTDYIGIHHIHQGGKPGAKLGQYPADGGQDARGDISGPIFQRKRLLGTIVYIGYTSIAHSERNVFPLFLNFF